METKQEYRSALARIGALFNATHNSEEEAELLTLVNAVEAFETRHFRIEPPTLYEAIRFRLEQEIIYN